MTPANVNDVFGKKCKTREPSTGYYEWLSKPRPFNAETYKG